MVHMLRYKLRAITGHSHYQPLRSWWANWLHACLARHYLQTITKSFILAIAVDCASRVIHSFLCISYPTDTKLQGNKVFIISSDLSMVSAIWIKWGKLLKANLNRKCVLQVNNLCLFLSRSLFLGYTSWVRSDCFTAVDRENWCTVPYLLYLKENG